MRGLLWFALAAVAFWLLVRSFARAAAASTIPQFAPPDAPDVGYTPPPGAALQPMGTDLSLLDRFAAAWAAFEGSLPTNRNQRNNNPANLKYSAWEGAVGKDSGGFAIFGSMQQGTDAQESYIARLVNAHPDWDLFDFFEHALGRDTNAPPVDDEGDSDAEADFVASRLGVDPTQPISSYLGAGQ